MGSTPTTRSIKKINIIKKYMRVSYIGNTPAFQAEKVGSTPTTRSIKKINIIKKYMRVSYIGNTPAFQAEKVGSTPTTRSNKTTVNSCFYLYLSQYALVVQLDRALDFESRSREFESHQVHQYQGL